MDMLLIQKLEVLISDQTMAENHTNRETIIQIDNKNIKNGDNRKTWKILNNFMAFQSVPALFQAFYAMH